MVFGYVPALSPPAPNNNNNNNNSGRGYVWPEGIIDGSEILKDQGEIGTVGNSNEKGQNLTQL